MSNYEGKILNISVGDNYSDDVFCAYEYLNGKSLMCYGLGKSHPFDVLISDVKKVVEDSQSPLKKIPDGALFETDKGIFKLDHREHDSVLSVKSSKDVWFSVADACNLHHLLYFTGADEKEPIKTSADLTEVSSEGYNLFDAEKLLFRRADLA